MSRVNRFEYKDWKGFGSRVKRCREQINMTKERFAEEIGRSENFVAEIEKGNTSCSVHTLHKISEVLRVPTDTLLYGKVENMKESKSNKEILEEIINRCSDDEIQVITDIIIATYPNLYKIVEKRREKHK
ncbi:MAG: helix-turn-helix domain-containing protein [Clostridia bacterium]